MRLLIAGASGRTGQMLVRRAAEHGHDVTALVRDTVRLQAVPDGVRTVLGDVLEPATLAPAVAGRDAVVSLLAPRPRTDGRVYVEGTRNLADAAVAAGVRRFIVVSAEGAGVSPGALPLGYRLVMQIPVVARLYPDIARMEQELEQRAHLDWTIVRPAVLTNGRRTGRYRAEEGDVVAGGLRISRADLAEFLLAVLEDGRYVCKRVALAR